MYNQVSNRATIMHNNQFIKTALYLWGNSLEQYTDFRMLLLRHSKNGIMISGLLGLMATASYIIVKLLFFDSELGWTYNESDTFTVVLIDKLLLSFISIVFIILSRSKLSLSALRFVCFTGSILAAFFILADDIYNQDITSTSGYFTIILLIVSSCVPFKPWHTLLMGLSMILMLYPGTYYISTWLGAASLEADTGQFTHMIIITVIVVGISMFLYYSRYTTYMARRKAEGFMDQLILDDEEEEESTDLSIRKEKEYLAGKQPLLVNPIEVPSSEQLFLNKVKAVIELHMADSNFGVEWLAHEVAISPRQLQRKLKSSIGLTAGALIRVMRLQRASQYLQQNAGNINEIAYKVGFNDAGYFSRIFKKMYGVNPSEYDLH